ncbi:hypothetical protein [Streptomyces sp. NPDC007369]|uniref:hypothetical protein n=1 Tax=Streptomyces sp. NPDC007369 TaxID=3154589 RepID=UPI0033FD584C
MRLRTAAVAFLGAFALSVPLAGPSLADDFDDRPNIGRLDYIVDGERRQIRPADNDTCYELTGTSRRDPATAVRNATKSRATLFTQEGCNGRSERELEPGDIVYDVEVRSVVFTPVHVNKDDKHDPFGDDRSDDDRGGFESNSRPEHAAMGAVEKASVLPKKDGPEPQDGPSQAEEQQRQEEQRQEEQRQEEQRQEEQRQEEQRQEEPQQPQDEQQPREPRDEQQPQEPREDQAPAEEQQEMPGQHEMEEQGPQDMRQDRQEEHHEEGPDMFDAAFRSIS